MLTIPRIWNSISPAEGTGAAQCALVNFQRKLGAPSSGWSPGFSLAAQHVEHAALRELRSLVRAVLAALEYGALRIGHAAGKSGDFCPELRFAPPF